MLLVAGKTPLILNQVSDYLTLYELILFLSQMQNVKKLPMCLENKIKKFPTVCDQSHCALDKL